MDSSGTYMLFVENPGSHFRTSIPNKWGNGTEIKISTEISHQRQSVRNFLQKLLPKPVKKFLFRNIPWLQNYHYYGKIINHKKDSEIPEMHQVKIKLPNNTTTDGTIIQYDTEFLKNNPTTKKAFYSFLENDRLH